MTHSFFIQGSLSSVGSSSEEPVAGRALDSHIAQEVLKWQPRLSVEDDAKDHWVKPTDPGSSYSWMITRGMDNWKPSTCREDAFVLVDYMLEVFEVFELSYDGTWHARFAGEPSNWESLWGHAETPMLAICRAAIQEF